MEKVNAKKIDLTSITSPFLLEYNFPLTTQNIVVAFQINREVSEAKDEKKEKQCVFILRRLREPSLSMLSMI